MMRKLQFDLIKLSFFALIALLLFSCNNRIEFEQYQKLEKQSWNRFNIIKFEVPVEDTQNAFDIALVIRHLPEFRIKELPVNVTIYFPSGEMRTAEYVIPFTSKDGESLSECLGDLCDISFSLRENFIFSEAGIVRFEIENKWPRIELPGVLEVGLTVRKSK